MMVPRVLHFSDFILNYTCINIHVSSLQAASGALTAALALTTSLSDDRRTEDNSLLVEQSKSLSESLQTLLSTLRYICTCTCIYVRVSKYSSYNMMYVCIQY